MPARGIARPRSAESPSSSVRPIGRCRGRARRGTVRGMGSIAIRPPCRDDLRAGATLLARSLDFAAQDAIPAWLMRVTDGCGGLTLVALDGDRVVGISYAFPDLSHADRGLYACGLAIAPDRRGQGIARALKLEQRRRARH